MNDVNNDPIDGEPPGNPSDEIHARLERLERETAVHRKQTEQRVVLAELKLEAIRAGMIDLDGLQFLNLDEVRPTDNGDAPEVRELIIGLKRAKPWLFSTLSSSSTAKVPSSVPIRPKLAKDMSDEEYRVARANIIRRAAL